jgi:very-short-patch-repair endonuclease
MLENEFNEYRRSQLQTEPEWRFENLLTAYKIDFEYQFNISYICKSGRKSNKKYDFYIPSINTLVEIDGEAWHDEEWCKERNFKESHLKRVRLNIENDRLKDEIAKNNGFELIRVKNTDNNSLMECVRKLHCIDS